MRLRYHHHAHTVHGQVKQRIVSTRQPKAPRTRGYDPSSSPVTVTNVFPYSESYPTTEFMTRHNLEEHISWLLSNVAVCKPASIEYPSARDSATISFSQSLDKERLQLNTPTTSTDISIHPSTRSRPSINAVGTSNLGSAAQGVQDTGGREEQSESMAKLTSASKPKKSSLVLKQQQLPTPTSDKSGHGGGLQRAYTAKLLQDGKLGLLF